MAGVDELDIQSPIETALDEDDLSDIMDELGIITSKWRNVGMVLGLRQDILESIKHLHQNDNQMLMTAMATEWLKRNYNVERFGKPSWKKLVEAVEAKSGGHNTALAQDIARRHSVAFIPSEQPDGEYKGTLSTSSLKEISRIRQQPSVHLTTAVEQLIMNHKSYHELITGSEAETILKAYNHTCYLTRFSEQQMKYVLSVAFKKKDGSFAYKHFQIVKNHGTSTFKIEGAEKSFNSVEKMLEYYQHNALTPIITHIGKPCFKKESEKKCVIS